MTDLFSLGEIYSSDFLKEGESPRGDKVELKLLMDDQGNVRLERSADPSIMYGKYWYRSGINNTMREELRGIVNSIRSVFKIGTNQAWLDIASNDGTLLSFLPEGIIKIGIDPADDSFKREAEKHGDIIIQDYFSSGAYFKYMGNKAKVITSIAMFYDVEDRESFLNGINEVMDDNGLWVLQLSYTPLMLHQLAFDNICHEHLYYYSLFNIKALLEANGFKIMDCQLNDINGGSFRLYVMKQHADESLFGTQPYRDICRFRIKSLLFYEKSLEVDSPLTWKRFYNNINDLRYDVRAFIKEEKSKGKSIWCYGASTKGNTLLQYFGLDNTLITAIAERSPYKWGLRTIGTEIPIVPEDDMRKAQPDYVLVLPWHFIDEFRDRESDYLKKGGKFIVPCPKFEIISE